MRYGIEPAFVAALDRAEPRIGSGDLGMALQVKDVHDTLPHGFALENLFDGQRIDQRGRAAVLSFNCSLKLVDAHFHDSTLAWFYRALFSH